MRLDCPKCGTNAGYSRKTKTPMWRCSPARKNGGCGYEWDDSDFNDPSMDYKYCPDLDPAPEAIRLNYRDDSPNSTVTPPKSVSIYRLSFS